MEGILEEEGEMPLDIQKVINTNKEVPNYIVLLKNI